MVSRLLTFLLGGALAAAFAASTALAAGPADVTVRVEGASATLVPRTAVRTDTTAVNKDGVPAHTCTGTGAAGALEKATGGAWSGPWFDGLGYSVQTVKGETHAFPAPDYFTLWINHRSASEGVCGTTTELQQGDEVLFFVDRCVSDPVTFLCTNPPVLPLGLTAPATASPGVPFSVTVVEYAPDGSATPVAGATVTGGDAPATTNAAGTATINVGGGPFSLRATKANRAPSATETGCATAGADGECGTSVPPRPLPPCVTSGQDGACGTTDRTAPSSTITGLTEGRVFARGKGPRRITATVTSDVSGLLAVKLRLTRRVGPRCSYFSGRSERFRRSPCGAERGAWFGVGDREEVDYLLPSKLTRGRYVLDVNAVDQAHNRDDARHRGGNRIVFVVR